MGEKDGEGGMGEVALSGGNAREIAVDCFAGGGGTSTGYFYATGRHIDIAINHDMVAIAMHRANHPFTRHYCEDIWEVDPREAVKDRPVGLLWASPDCTHHSKARGGKPRQKNIRGLAWVVVRWAATVQPRVIILENVEEFQDWGPLTPEGQPDPKQKGRTFKTFVNALRRQGYHVEWRELRACDYGAPTIRKRLFLIARCDNCAISWPAPTHGDPKSEAVKLGKLKPWCQAAEIIDWSLPCPSIFATKQEIKAQYGLNAVRPLANNTQRRIIRGVDKFTIKSNRPFIVEVNHKGGGFRGQGLDEPYKTATAKHGTGIVDPLLAPFHMHNNESATGTDMREPLNTAKPLSTITAVGSHELIAPNLIQYHSEQADYVRGQKPTEPIMTVDAANRYGLAAAHLTEYYGNAQGGLNPIEPLRTVTTKDREGLTLAHIQKYYGGVIGTSVNNPLPAVTAIDHSALTAAHMIKFKGDNLGQSPDEPLQTATAGGGQFGVVYATIIKADPGADLRCWPKIRALLNEYCGYNLADDEVILLWISGTPYFIADIGLRMLTPRELYNAQGFPPTYIIKFIINGKPISKAEQIAKAGNAVPPQFSKALVRANLPELCADHEETGQEYWMM